MNGKVVASEKFPCVRFIPSGEIYLYSDMGASNEGWYYFVGGSPGHHMVLNGPHETEERANQALSHRNMTFEQKAAMFTASNECAGAREALAKTIADG